MDTATYFEMILSILIWLTFATLILIFMYMFHGKGEESEAQAASKSRLIRRLEKVSWALIL